ncbi:MAG: zinc ribbon domain-containing protein [Methanomassiliicoccus sp.]|nr:zinc ribbon domain-containing protein [Methanomassiliicoccus sp.]
MPYCQKCGNKLEDEERFCPQCGQDSYVPLTGFYRPPVHTVFPPVPPPTEIVQQVMMVAPSKARFPLGIISGMVGGIVGLNLAIFILWIASIGDALGGDSTEVYRAASLIVLFSVVGLAGCFLERYKMAGGILMWVAAVGLYLFLNWIGWISVISFALGGALMVWESRRESREENQMVLAGTTPSPASPSVAPPATSNEGAPPSEEVETRSSDDEYDELPRRKWSKEEWKDNIIAAAAIILILAGALLAAWYFYIR